MFLIDDILLAPLKGVIWLSKQIDNVAKKELSDDSQIKEQLMELQLRFELDEIGEEEYDKEEKELLERLDAIRQANEEV
ncbi:gas vesicle protein GvpG [bacterium]|nr:gas vesicle protein GvpG [bacterium]MBU1753281.1 gas vesicle protein GvpG [bacterium]